MRLKSAMSAPALALFNLALSQRSCERLITNAEMLKATITVEGWPKRLQIGDTAESAAWVLVDTPTTAHCFSTGR